MVRHYERAWEGRRRRAEGLACVAWLRRGGLWKVPACDLLAPSLALPTTFFPVWTMSIDQARRSTSGRRNDPQGGSRHEPRTRVAGEVTGDVNRCCRTLPLTLVESWYSYLLTATTARRCLRPVLAGLPGHFRQVQPASPQPATNRLLSEPVGLSFMRLLVRSCLISSPRYLRQAVWRANAASLLVKKKRNDGGNDIFDQKKIKRACRELLLEGELAINGVGHGDQCHRRKPGPCAIHTTDFITDTPEELSMLTVLH